MRFAQEEEIRHSAGGERPDYTAHFGLIAARAVKIAAYLSGRPVRTLLAHMHGVETRL